MEFFLVVSLVKYVGDYAEVVLHALDSVFDYCAQDEDECGLAEVVDGVVTDFCALYHF